MPFNNVQFYFSQHIAEEQQSKLRKLVAKYGGIICERPGNPSCFHVLPRFTEVEEELESLRQQKLLIIGPPCIQYAVDKQEPLPQKEIALWPLYGRFMGGITISCSGIPPALRDGLHTLVKYMGGRFERDFTSSVTHLIVTMPGSEKYKVALELKTVVITTPDWIKKCWHQDSLLPAHKFPLLPFTGYTITVTGMPYEARENIKTLCTQNGGQYSSDLNKKCTHLVVERPGSKKYVYAKEWGIKIISSKWFFDSVQRQASLDEAQYPVNEQAQDLYNLEIAPSSGTIDSQSLSQSQHHSHSNSNDEDPQAVQNLVHKNRLVVEDNQKVENGHDNQKRKRAEFEKRQIPEKVKDTDPPPSKRVAREGNERATMILCSSSQTKLSPHSYLEGPEIEDSQCTRDTMAGDGVLYVDSNVQSGSNSVASLLSYSPYSPSSLFTGITFLCKGFDSPKERQEINETLSKCGGAVLFSDYPGTGLAPASSVVAYLLCPHGTPGLHPIGGMEQLPVPRMPIVTPQWIARCIQEGIILQPTEFPVLFTPLPHPLPLPKPQNPCSICISGFAGKERENIVALIVALGFDYTDRFTKKNTHLICKEPNGPKYNKALEWQKAAVVSLQWLLVSAQKGRIQDVNRFTFGGYSHRVKTDNNYDLPVVKREGEKRSRSPRDIPEIREVKKETTKSIKRKEAGTSSPLLHYNSSSPFLGDVSVFVSKRFPQQVRDYLHDLVASMGGSCVTLFDQSITHYIHEGKQDSSKDFRMAKSCKHVKFVSPMWLDMCKRYNKRVDENNYPPVRNPRMTLGLDVLPVAPIKLEQPHSSMALRKHIKREQLQIYSQSQSQFSQSSSQQLSPEYSKAHMVEDKNRRAFELMDYRDDSFLDIRIKSEKEETEGEVFVPPTQPETKGGSDQHLVVVKREKIEHEKILNIESW